MLAFLYNLGLENNNWRMPLAMVIAAAATYLLCFPIRKLSLRLHLLDQPTNRSSHSTPVPRTGGIAIIFGAIVGVGFVFKPSLPFLLVLGIGGAIALISLADDIRSIPPIPRLIVQIVVAVGSILLVKLYPTRLDLPFIHMSDLPVWVGVALATLYVVAFVNFYNFMDGINGIAASQGLTGGVTLALLLLYASSGNSVFTAAALAGACGGFLPHNAPRARMFMGDTGSTTLGFGFAMLTLIGGARTDVPWIAFVLPFSLFIYDAGFTVIKRVVQGHNPLRPHREFHFHLLIRCGWSHARVMRWQDGLLILSAVASWGYFSFADDAIRVAILAGVAVMLVSYSVIVHTFFRRHQRAVQQSEAERPQPEAQPKGGQA